MILLCPPLQVTPTEKCSGSRGAGFERATLAAMTTEQMEGETTTNDESRDFCSFLLSRYGNATREDHQLICTVISAMTQELKDHNIPLVPVSYFGATISSLNCLSSVSSGAEPIIAGLLTVLSTLLPKLSVTVVRVKGNLVLETVGRLLMLDSVADDAVKAGLNCMTHSIVVSEKRIWPDIAPSYQMILGFIADHRPKVRKHCCLSVCHILKSFQGSSLHVLASECIANIFEKYILLAGGSQSFGDSSMAGSSGAVEILYILAALKHFLPLLSKRPMTSILKYFRSLLELHQIIVTKHITTILHTFFSSPSSEFSSEALLDLLCILALAVVTEEKSAEGLAFTAKLLHIGVIKVYDHDRDICVAKLPVFFNALGEILLREHEESIHASTEALKDLITGCVDEPLVAEGVERIKAPLRRSVPTVIEKICASIESMLTNQYNAVWDMCFQVVSALFDKLGKSSMYLMKGSIQSLADMHNLPVDDFIYRKQLFECVGSAVAAMGPETFLSVLPLGLDSGDVSKANVWLLPILKQYIIGANLSFFMQSILKMVRVVEELSDKHDREGRIISSRKVRGFVYSIWSLLPAFCNYPRDTAISFGNLAKILCATLREDPDLHGIICSSIRILIEQNRRVLADEGTSVNFELGPHEQRARGYYTKQVAVDNLNALRMSSPTFFSVLAVTFLNTAKDNGGCLKATISEFASISDKKVVKQFFRNTMEELLKVTREAAAKKQSKQSNSIQIDNTNDVRSQSFVRLKIMDLAWSLLLGLDEKEVELLYVAIRNTLKDEEGFLQKKAYKILSAILKDREEFISSHLQELLPWMIELMPFCHFSAKRHRLDSLYFLITYASKDASEQKYDIISSFLSEIILALKEVNKKTRNRAYDLLVKIGHASDDEGEGAKRENLHFLFNMVAGGLAGETPHMISAAIKGLARLAYEFSDLINAVYGLLPSAFLLLQRKNKEIIKAILGLLKVLVAKSQVEGLCIQLKGIVEGLLKWQDNPKNHFKAKVKLLLGMLVKKCGMDAVKAVMPEEHMKLLTNIRKIGERRERKLASFSDGETGSCRSGLNASRWNHTNFFSDFGVHDGSDGTVVRKANFLSKTRKGVAGLSSKNASIRPISKLHRAKCLLQSLQDQLDDPVDLLHHQKTVSVMLPSLQPKRRVGTGDDMEFDADGRLIIHDDDIEERKNNSKLRDRLSGYDTRSQTNKGTHLNAKSVLKAQKRQKTSDISWAYTGKEYMSKGASGDVKRKGKPDPYAYWPLDRKMLNRRGQHKVIARRGMASVLNLTKKLEGKSVSSALSVKGLKFKRRQNCNKKCKPA